jgi:hypothetical protein
MKYEGIVTWGTEDDSALLVWRTLYLKLDDVKMRLLGTVMPK